MSTIKMTSAEWIALGTQLYGEDKTNWKFKCPSCGYVATAKDWQAASAPEGAVAFSCVGRYTESRQEIGSKEGGPCNYTGGGLFKLNPIEVVFDDGSEGSFFDFADRQ